MREIFEDVKEAFRRLGAECGGRLKTGEDVWIALV